MIITIIVFVFIVLAIILIGLAVFIYFNSDTELTNDSILHVLLAIFFVLLAFWVETTKVLDFLKS
jgi:hypothetical protein